MAQHRKKDAEVIFVEAPIGLKARLAAVAKANRRSVNGEAVVAIERHVEAEEAAGTPAAEPAPRAAGEGQAGAVNAKEKGKKGDGK